MEEESGQRLVRILKAPQTVMAPIIGLKPINGRWDGGITDEHYQAIVEDTREMIESRIHEVIQASPIPPAAYRDVMDVIELTTQAAVLSACRRMAVEYEGCVIDLGIEENE